MVKYNTSQFKRGTISREVDLNTPDSSFWTSKMDSLLGSPDEKSNNMTKEELATLLNVVEDDLRKQRQVYS